MARLAYGRGSQGGSLRLRLRVVVEPDHFYVAFFAALLERGAGSGEAEIRTALAAARASSFVVFDREVGAAERTGAGAPALEATSSICAP